MSDLALHHALPEARLRAEAPAGRWNPYLMGAGIGVLSWLVFVIVAAPIGITTAGAQIAGGVAALAVGPDAVAANAYWARNPMRLDYGTLFLVGTAVGAFVSALLRGGLRVEHVPAVWAERFGPSVARRYAGAFLGGAIIMFASRLANGCTSGNGISQGLQLAVVGWVFLVTMFASGIATAWLMFRGR
ncbi:YeeE/YedE family protein [Roseomonas sp. PWR1]|uniref:YeeE/YedE family protein n=1 Tax=Roseomonas nitratireducens TaxID=2820810 RepID=A0ABS4B0A0_9PROT|nr:YeeE/YedE thiosulfate transporter family protein [Neoroseomonas nitratireducens]MBP0466498.1 YeeE/YedE family protein [Neoroseomonas nitratireducens]